ncbi:purine permease, partial [Streptomyces sp. SID10244]|nr:purine permease [Streptomyces sp. SID10244]
IVLALIPKMGAAVAALPGPVVGGVGLVLFGTVTMIGIRTLTQIDLNDHVNVVIAATSIGIGLLPEYVPDMLQRLPDAMQIIFGSGITLTAIVAFTLNLVFRHSPLRRRVAAEPVTNETTDIVVVPAEQPATVKGSA